MIPASFEEANVVLGAPEGQQSVGPLNVWRGSDSNERPVVISCWKITTEEMKMIQESGGRIWLYISGNSMPPVYLSAAKPPFPEAV